MVTFVCIYLYFSTVVILRVRVDIHFQVPEEGCPKRGAPKGEIFRCEESKQRPEEGSLGRGDQVNNLCLGRGV